MIVGKPAYKYIASQLSTVFSPDNLAGNVLMVLFSNVGPEGAPRGAFLMNRMFGASGETVNFTGHIQTPAPYTADTGIVDYSGSLTIAPVK